MKKYRIGMLLLILTLALSLLGGTALAAGESGTVSVEAVHNGTPLTGMRFCLYKVADLDEYGKVTATAKAAAVLGQTKMPETVSDSEAWRSVLNTLGDKAAQLDLTAEAAIGSDGRLSFPGAHGRGIYVIVGDKLTLGRKIYTPGTAWALLPTPTQGMNVTVEPKLDVHDVDNPTTLQVVIKWDDKGLEQYRPTNVDVELYNGTTKDRDQNITNATWTHTWTGLDPSGSWDVEELVPEGYKIIDKSQDGNVITITNKPDTVLIDPPINKMIEGTGYPKTSVFSFRMKVERYPDAVTPIPMPAGSTEEGGRAKVVRLSAEEAVKGHEFGEFALHKTGTYVYTLSEERGTESGYTYDSNTYTMTVQVFYKGTGDNKVLDKTVTYTDQRGQAVQTPRFVNTYKPTDPPAVSLTLGASKVIKGAPKTTADFEFRLVGKNNAPMPSGTTGTQKTVKVHGQGSASFGSISFTAPGKYVYEVSEVNARLSGYTYDTTVYTVTVEVEKKADGTLSMEVTAVDNHKKTVKWDELVFTNVYKEPAPQTGVLWWPVPVLLAAGLLLSFVGLVRRKHEN